MSLTTLILVVFAGLGGGLAIFYYRRTSSLYALLVEGANRYEEQRSRTAQMEDDLTAIRVSSAETQRTETNLRTELEGARAKAASWLQQFESKDNELRIVRDKLELQKGHLLRQLELEAERKAALDTERNELAAKLDTLNAKRDDKAAKQLEELRGQLRDARDRLELSEKRALDLERRMKDMPRPDEIRQLRRRLMQYDRLYTSMRGLREMADERSRNWEVALRKFSEWILTQGRDRRRGASAGPRASLPQSIGPLVGQALEAIGARLVDEAADFATGDAAPGGREADSAGSEPPTEAFLEAEQKAADALLAGDGRGSETTVRSVTP